MNTIKILSVLENFQLIVDAGMAKLGDNIEQLQRQLRQKGIRKKIDLTPFSHTWETQHFLRRTKVGVISDKLENQQGGGERECWKSDLPIVAMKQGNACGAKGQAVSDQVKSYKCHT